MNIVLDTNAFYSFFGVERLNLPVNDRINKEKFHRLLYGDHKIYVTTYTILEAIFRFGDDFELIKELLLFINNEVRNIYISSNLNMDKQYIMTLINSDKQSFKKLREILIDEKITIESNYTALFLLTVSQLYLNAYCLDHKVINLTYNQGKEMVLHKSKIIDREVYKFFVKIYQVKNIKSDVKDFFNFLLNREIDLFNALFSTTSNSLDYKLFNITEFVNNFIREYKPDESSHPNACEFIAKYAHKILQAHKLDTNHLIIKILGLMLESKPDMYQAEYIAFLLMKWGLRGAKFNKNDIIDMFIVSSLSNERTVMISFDDDIIDFLKQHGHISMRYIMNIYRI